MSTVVPGTASAVEQRLDDAARARGAAVDVAAPGAMWDATRIPEAYLPALAWALSVDAWSPAWTLAQRRLAVARAIESHRAKGTQAGIARLMDLYGARYTYRERPEGRAFTAALDVTTLQGALLGSWAGLSAALARTKRASVHLHVTPADVAPLRVRIAVVAAVVVTVRLHVRIRA